MKKLIAVLIACWSVSGYAQSNIQTTVNFNLNNLGIVLNQNPTITRSLSSKLMASGVVTISTNYTALSFGSVTNAGLALLINTSTNSWNTITYGTVSNSYGERISPGGIALIEFNTNSWGAVSLTNSCDLQYFILSR